MSGWSQYDRWKTTNPRVEEESKRELERDRAAHRAAIRALGPKAERLYWAERDYRAWVVKVTPRGLIGAVTTDRLNRGVCCGCGFKRLPLPADWPPGKSYDGPPRCGCPDSRVFL